MEFKPRTHLGWLLCTEYFNREKLMDVWKGDDFDTDNFNIEIKLNGVSIVNEDCDKLINFLVERIESNIQQEYSVQGLENSTDRKAKIIVDKMLNDKLSEIDNLIDSLGEAKEAARDLVESAWENDYD